MCLIFDASESSDFDARGVGDYVAIEFGLETQVFDNEIDAQNHDPIPAILCPPVLHVERYSLDDDDSFDKERQVIKRVRALGGHFVGT